MPLDSEQAADALAAKIASAQAECGYFEQLGVVWDLRDDKFCWYDMGACEGREHCPCGKW